MQWLIDIIMDLVGKKNYITLADVELYLKGMIVAWSGTYATVPEGWAVCDGANGTPDLRWKFIRGPYVAGHVGGTGGVTFHSHTFTGDGHRHDLIYGLGASSGGDIKDQTEYEPAVGTTDPSLMLPPYLMLAYIMKL